VPAVQVTVRKQQVLELVARLDEPRLLAVPNRNRLAVVMSRMLRYHADDASLSLAFQAAPFPIVTQLTPSGQFVSVLAVPTESKGFDLTISSTLVNERYTIAISRQEVEDMFKDEPVLLRAMNVDAGWRMSSRKLVR
jgi:hypothetical protein